MPWVLVDQSRGLTSPGDMSPSRRLEYTCRPASEAMGRAWRSDTLRPSHAHSTSWGAPSRERHPPDRGGHVEDRRGGKDVGREAHPALLGERPAGVHHEAVRLRPPRRSDSPEAGGRLDHHVPLAGDRVGAERDARRHRIDLPLHDDGDVGGPRRLAGSAAA